MFANLAAESTNAYSTDHPSLFGVYSLRRGQSVTIRTGFEILVWYASVSKEIVPVEVHTVSRKSIPRAVNTATMNPGLRIESTPR